MTQQAGIAEGDGGERQEQCGQRAVDGRRRGGSSHGRAVAGALAEPNAGGTDWHGRAGTGIRLVDSEPITAPSAGVPQQARSGLPRGRRVTATPLCFSMPLSRRAASARWGEPPPDGVKLATAARVAREGGRVICQGAMVWRRGVTVCAAAGLAPRGTINTAEYASCRR
jgi:hypothetical protein